MNKLINLVQSKAFSGLRMGMSYEEIREVWGTEDDRGRLGKRSIVLKYNNMQIYLTNGFTDMISIYLTDDFPNPVILGEYNQITAGEVRELLDASNIGCKVSIQSDSDMNILTNNGVNFQFQMQKMYSITIMS